jgi:hypothetical protein
MAGIVPLLRPSNDGAVSQRIRHVNDRSVPLLTDRKDRSGRLARPAAGTHHRAFELCGRATVGGQVTSSHRWRRSRAWWYSLDAQEVWRWRWSEHKSLVGRAPPDGSTLVFIDALHFTGSMERSATARPAKWQVWLNLQAGIK